MLYMYMYITHAVLLDYIIAIAKTVHVHYMYIDNKFISL